MAAELDVYREWLGVKEPNRPLDYYQLLRVARFDDDQERIRRNYRKLNAHVRKYSTGEYAAQSQLLLNELARAMLCLTDLQRKADYDESLGRTKVTAADKKSIEHILLRSGEVDKGKVDKAKHYAEATGLTLRDALVQQKAASPEVIMQAYAESIGLPYLNLKDITIDKDVFPKISAVMARTYSVSPVMIDNGQLLLASPNPIDLQLEDDLKMRLGMPIRMVLCTPGGINEVIKEHYPREAAESELSSRGEVAKAAAAEPSALGKVWNRVKKWVEENNKKK